MGYTMPKDHPVTLQPPLEIINDGTNRDSWLVDRVPNMTATQVTAIAGSNPYTKAIDVWNEKTDPDYNADHLRNKYLEERAAHGTLREPEIIAWASEEVRAGGPGNPFIPSSALVTRAELAEGKVFPPAATPDGFKYAREGALVLIECKATQQDWQAKGVPQHVYDQMQWQMYVTNAITVWLAMEKVKWVKGVVVETEYRWMKAFHPDPKRLAFLLAKVEQFEAWVRAGTAPESDIELAVEPVIEFDDDEETVAAKEAEIAEARETDALLTELAEIRERIGPDLAREKAITDILKPRIVQYDGRRVHLIGQRFIAKLVRGTRTVKDESVLPEELQRAMVDWVESETVKYEPNPEYVAPTPADANTTESE